MANLQSSGKPAGSPLLTCPIVLWQCRNHAQVELRTVKPFARAIGIVKHQNLISILQKDKNIPEHRHSQDVRSFQVHRSYHLYPAKAHIRGIISVFALLLQVTLTLSFSFIDNHCNFIADLMKLTINFKTFTTSMQFIQSAIKGQLNSLVSHLFQELPLNQVCPETV